MTAPEHTGDDAETLAKVLYVAGMRGARKHVAAEILASDWLAARDAAVRAEVVAEVLAACDRLDTDYGTTWPRSAEGRFVRDTCTSVIRAVVAPHTDTEEDS